MLPLTLLALVVGSAEQAFALRSSSVPEDLYAYPKYSIHFLNGQPVLNETAQRWLHDGIVDQDEFLGHKSPRDASNLFKSIAGGPEDAELAPAANRPPTEPDTRSPTVQKMKLGHSDYLCLLPPPPVIPSSDEDTQQAPKPIRTWELLQPLEGTCLYHRQGWFSYAYCHGRHVRQFRELEPNLPFGLKTPAEDPNEPAYTLGHAPTPAGGGHDETGGTQQDQQRQQQQQQHDQQHLSVADRTALIANRLELARGAGQRYLNLYMGDGTVCDKSGQPRQVNVQFHCGTGPRDVITWIKENKTCSYTLVIHTPRLCNEPGFKDPRDDLPDTPLRCRKIVDTFQNADPTLPDASSPFERRKPKPLPAPARKEKGTKDGDNKKAGTTSGSSAEEKLKDAQAKMIRAALDALLGRNKDKGKENTDDGAKGADDKSKLADKIVAVSIDDDGEIRILDPHDGAKEDGDAKVDDDSAAAPTLRNNQLGEDDGDIMEIELADGEDAARLMKILRDAGFEARFPGTDDDEKEGKHDEL